MNAPRSRPPLPQSRDPQALLCSLSSRQTELFGIDVALHLGVILRAHALDAIVVLEHDGALLAAAGESASSHDLTLFAAAMAGGSPIGARRDFDGGRIVAEIMPLATTGVIVAVRREGTLPGFEASALGELRAFLADLADLAAGGGREAAIDETALDSADSADFDDFAGLDFDLTPVGPAEACMAS